MANHSEAAMRTDRSSGIRFLWLVAVSLPGMLTACGTAEERKTPTPEAGYVVVQSTTVALPIELAGRTSAYETSEVRPTVSGVVKARLFPDGTIVHAAQTLYQID